MFEHTSGICTQVRVTFDLEIFVWHLNIPDKAEIMNFQKMRLAVTYPMVGGKYLAVGGRLPVLD